MWPLPLGALQEKGACFTTRHTKQFPVVDAAERQLQVLHYAEPEEEALSESSNCCVGRGNL